MVVITGKVRGSYVNVFAPRPARKAGETEKYSMMLLIPKSDKKTLADLKAAQQDAIEKRWGAKPPANLKKTLRDGDAEDMGPEARGHYFMNVSSRDKPQVVDRNLNPIIDPMEFVSGDYCRVSLNSFTYEGEGKGVSFALNNVQVLGKGEPLGRARAEDEFGTYTEEDADDLL